MTEETKIVQEDIKPINIEDEMKSSYISYAMSVIVSRALPDVRDGLKPVHRRILYTMHEMRLYHNKPFKKSARIVGDVMGKYHPHGDAAIYNSLVRMAQPFSLRYMLIEGQGNFGSIDGDSAAAMRYSEARMQKISLEMLRDIEKETVDFVPNYDNSLLEPSVLPSVLPNLLINGTEGIAVAMSTKIPPHNITEVLSALIKLVDNPDMSIEELNGIIKAPDFPTGGFIYGTKGIEEAYKTGSGRVDIRAKSEIVEDSKKKKNSIIITELPYQVIKSDLIKAIAILVRDKKIEDISDIQDQSGRKGLRIVIELKKNANAQIVLNQLYKMTKLQIAYHMNMLALHHGVPKLMNLKAILKAFLDHRRDVITRRTIFDLKKAEQRMHILEGYKIALNAIDEIIEIIKSASNRGDAKDKIIEKYGLTEVQTEAVLDLRLHRLTAMEIQKIVDEMEQLQKSIDYFNLLLSDSDEMIKVIKDEFQSILSTYSDKRRSKIIPKEGDISIEDLIADDDMVVTISHENYIKRVPATTYSKQRRGGKGKVAMKTKDEDFVEQLFISSNHSSLLFFTNRGKVYRLKVYELPEVSRTSRGKPIINLLDLDKDEVIETILSIKSFTDDNYIIMITDNGTIKKTHLSEFESIRANGKIAINIKDDDRLNFCSISDGTNDVFVVSKNGKSIRFSEENIRSMGRTAAGVRAIRLIRDDVVVGMTVIKNDKEILVVSERGYGKKTSIEEYKTQRRGGQGVITMNINPKTGGLITAMEIDNSDHLMLITNSGKLIRISINNLNTIGRVTQGVKLINLDDDEYVVSVAKIADNSDE